LVSQLVANNWKDGGKVETDGLETGRRSERGQWKEGTPKKRPNVSQKIRSKGMSQAFPWFPS
jgi:hypothetical protein